MMTHAAEGVGAPDLPLCDRFASQRAAGLVEALIVLGLVISVILGLIGGLLLVIRVSDTNSSRQELQLATGSYAEHLKASPYTPCADAAHYSALPGFDPPASITVSVQSVKYWDRQPVGGGVGAWKDACTPGEDFGAQLLEVLAESADRSYRLQLVKAIR